MSCVPKERPPRFCETAFRLMDKDLVQPEKPSSLSCSSHTRLWTRRSLATDRSGGTSRPAAIASRMRGDRNARLNACRTLLGSSPCASAIALTVGKSPLSNSSRQASPRAMAFTRGVPVCSRKDVEARRAGGDTPVPAARLFVTAARAEHDRRMDHFATRRTLLGLRTGSFRPVSRLENAAASTGPWRSMLPP